MFKMDATYSFTFCLLCLGISLAAKVQPNIILIVADDLGFNDVSFHGSMQIPTPNIDELAYDGVILSNYYVSPICTPTRGALMTGRHPIHLGLQHETIHPAAPYGLPLDETTIAQELKKLGYMTHIVGKWHLGFFKEEYTPTKRGFDSHLGYYSGKEDYYNHCNDEDGWLGYDFFKNGSVFKPTFGEYSTFMYTKHAEEIIHNHDSSKPLFLYVAHQAVHSANNDQPLQVPAEYLKKFAYIKHEGRRTYAAMVSVLDESVKNITDALKKSHLYDNSVIIFTTDNGGPAHGFDVNYANNFPLRGVKDTLWEGGVRGAGLVHSKLIQNPGRIWNGMFHVCDWFPTFVSLAGGDVSRLTNLDGFDQWKGLSIGGPSARNEMLHNIDPIWNVSALRQGDFKLLLGDTYNGSWSGWYSPEGIEQAYALGHEGSRLYQDDPMVVECGPKPLNASVNCNPFKRPCLYNIPSDPCEYNNIADRNKDKVAELLTLLAKYQKSMVPPGNKPIDQNANPCLHGGNWEPWL